MIKSHEAKEKTEESKDSLESTQKEEERPRSPTPPPARKSPEPSCAICLEHLTNKSFTDSCFHMFCFTCLVEWSKVKPECPLCKKSFSSIVHNVRSFKDFDQYYVNKSRISDENRHCLRRFHYPTTLTPDRLHDNNRLELESYLSHRMRFAPHSVHSIRIYTTPQPSRRIPNIFRQRIYDENLWVFPNPNSNRIRCISPEFFRQNIACTHRLLPWLNRELLVVMPNNESQISFVIELIMALIVKYEIRSQEFHTLIEPYTAAHTAHFIHEFYHFAISPYETLETYDLHAQYDIAPIQTYETVSSPDSDVIPLTMEFPTSFQQSTSNESSRRKKQSHPKKKHSKASKKVKKLVLKRNSDKNCWENVTPSVPFGSHNYIPSSVSFELAGPSTSRGIPFLDSPREPSDEIDILNDVECMVTNDDDDECQVLEVLKPKSERTPEIVNLSSDDDELLNVVSEETMNSITEPVFLREVESTNEAKSDQTLIVSDDECEILYFKDFVVSPDAGAAKEVVLDKPIDYSLKAVEKKVDLESKTSTSEPCSSSNNNFEQDVSELHKYISDTKLEAVKPERHTVIQSVVRLASEDNTGSSSLSPLLKPKRRRTLILDDGSTESCSDNAQVSEIEPGKKKLKLKSVVAHYAFENSDEHDDQHSSLHKKHRERKKKKKKHKHRRRIFSSDSD